MVAPDESGVLVLQETVLKILESPHTDELTKQKALEVMAKGVTPPEHIHVSGCSFVCHENSCKDQELEKSTVDQTVEDSLDNFAD
jgi:hypothetical protein